MTTGILRNCKGCGKKKERDGLIKITLSGGRLFINPDSKTFGRSVYVCPNALCIKKIIKSKGISRALKFNNSEEIKKTENFLTALQQKLQ